MGVVFGIAEDFEAGDHGLEVVPAGDDDLHDVYEEEQAIAEGQDKMNNAGAAVAAADKGDPAELDWFIDGESGEDRAEAHHDDTGVSDLLGRIEFALGWGCLPDMKVVEEDEPGLFEAVAVWEEVAPFAGKKGVGHIREAIQEEDPHEHEVEGHSFGEAPGEVHLFIEGVREEREQDGVA